MGLANSIVSITEEMLKVVFFTAVLTNAPQFRTQFHRIFQDLIYCVSSLENLQE